MSTAGGMDRSAGLGIAALELFVEVLSQSEQGTAAGDDFYDRLCEAVCRLARMRRALIFRYDAATRRVRAAGAHGLDIEQFAQRARDRRVRAVRRARACGGPGRRGRGRHRRADPGRVRGAVPRAGAPRVRSDGGRGPRRRRDPGRSPAPGAAARRRRGPPAVDAGEGRRAGIRSADRRHAGREGPAARAPDRPRPRDPRGRDPAAVRRLDGARRRRRPARGCARAVRERDAACAERPSQRPAAAARPGAAGDRDDVRRRGRTALPRPSRAGREARSGTGGGCPGGPRAARPVGARRGGAKRATGTPARAT